MAGKGRAGIASGVIIGGVVLLGAILLAIAAMIVLSLISLFPSNRSVEQYGSQYQVSAAMLKALYSSSAASSISNSTVAENSALSAACAAAARSAGGVTSFAGCVITGLRASSGNSSNTSRRRRDSEFGAYLYGTANMYFTSACESSNDKSKTSNSSSVTSCAKTRLGICNGVFGGASGSSFKQWTGLATGSTMTFVDSILVAYVVRSLARVFGIPPGLAVGLARSLGLSESLVSQFSSGCKFVGFISQAGITSALAAQNSATTTQPTSTNVASG